MFVAIIKRDGSIDVKSRERGLALMRIPLYT